MTTLPPTDGRRVPRIDFRTGELSGERVGVTVRTIGDLRGVFRDEAARQSLPADQRIYRVQAYLPVPEGTEGGLFWGTTFIEPGMVGDEYFITKGHLHAKLDRAEYYVTVAGEGALILMDESRTTWFEPMAAGSVHYIPGRVAHRVANTGSGVLSFVASWPSDAGHDYETIASRGFSARLRCVAGAPALVEEP